MRGGADARREDVKVSGVVERRTEFLQDRPVVAHRGRELLRCEKEHERITKKRRSPRIKVEVEGKKIEKSVGIITFATKDHYTLISLHQEKRDELDGG